MSFYERFELLELVRDDGIKTFAAREIATGRAVQVHLFVNPRAPESHALLAKVDRLPEQERLRIVDRGQNEGTPYVVTGPLESYAGFREWLVAQAIRVPSANVPAAAPRPEAATSTDSPRLSAAGSWKIFVPPPAPAAPAVPSAPAPSLNDQFADLFETAERSLPPPPPSPVIAPAPPALPTPERTLQMAVPPVSAPAAKTNEAKPVGEFTRMFQAPAVPKAAAQPAAPTAPPPKPVTQAGEFTQMFQTPTGPGPMASSPAPPAATPPQQSFPPPAKPAGEFTRMFQAPARPASPPPPSSPAGASAPAPPRPPMPSPTQPPGEFTQMFQTPARPADPATPRSPAASAPPISPRPPVSPPAQAPGEFTQMFQAPAPASLPPAKPSSGGGEFTRFFETPAGSGPLPQSPAVQQPLAPQAPGNSGPNRVGEFTRVFGPRDVPPQQGAQAPVTSQPAGGATQSFATPRTPAPPAAMKQGPGEYTQMFAAPAPLTLGQPAPGAASSPQPVPVPPPSASRLPLILGLCAVLVLIIAVILLLVLRAR